MERTMSWDYKDQPDFELLTRLVAEVTGKPVKIRRIETGTDHYSIKISIGDSEPAIEVPDIVRVLRHDGSIGYLAEVSGVPSGPGTRSHVMTPDGETHAVPPACIERATEEESDAYIAELED
jgi:hypothetical protein